MIAICVLLTLILVALLGGIWFIYRRIYLDYVNLKIHMFHLIYTEAYGKPLIRRRAKSQSSCDDTIVGHICEQDGSWRQVFLKVPHHQLCKRQKQRK